MILNDKTCDWFNQQNWIIKWPSFKGITGSGRSDVGMDLLNIKSKANSRLLTFRWMVLTSIVTNDEIHIGPKLKRTQQVVTHEILQSDAFDDANISLRINAVKNSLNIK